MMRLTHLFSLILLVFASACSLSSAPPATPDTVGIQPTSTTAFIAPTFTTAPTHTPSSTSTTAPPPAQTNNTSLVQSGGGQTRCTVRTEWPQYTVVRGDTLASIARRTGSTVATLTSANCLANANLISVGQALRVPVMPSAPLPAQPPSQPCKATVNVPATNLYSGPNQNFAIVSTIAGADNFPVIGRSGSWYKLSYPGQAEAWIDSAVVTLSGNCMSIPTVYSNPAPCLLTIVVAAANLYSGPGTNYSVVSTIAGGDTFPVTGQYANWYRIAYPTTSDGWIDSAVITFSGDCTAVPTISVVGQPCAATVSVPAANLHNGPGSNYLIISTIAGADRFNVIGQPSSGALWYNVDYPTDGQAWINGAVVTLSGDCSNIPVVSSTRPPVSPTSSYTVVVSPTIGTSDGWIRLQAGGTVQLNISYTGDNPPTRVEYYLAPTGTGTTPTLIGSAEGTGGWVVNWTVQSGTLGYVNAKIYAASGNVYDTTAIQVMVE